MPHVSTSPTPGSCHLSPGAPGGRGTLDKQIAADHALVEATSDSYRLSDMGFRGGVQNYLSVLDSQCSLYAAQQTLIGVKLARLQNLVTLYKALGGGWSERVAQNTNVPGGVRGRQWRQDTV